MEFTPLRKTLKKSQQITLRYIHSIFLPASFVHPYHYFLFLKKSINSALLRSILIMQQPSITSSACPRSVRDRSRGVVIAFQMSIILSNSIFHPIVHKV